MAYNPAVSLVTYREPITKAMGEQAYCVSCHQPVAWFRPEGSTDWCGVVAMPYVETAVRDEAEDKFGRKRTRIIATRLKPGAVLHGGTTCGEPAGVNTERYAARFAAALSGTPIPHSEGPRVRRRRGGKRTVPAAAATTAVITTAAGVAEAIKALEEPAKPAGVTALPAVTPIVIPSTIGSTPAPTPAKRKAPDPTLPPEALRVWKKIDDVVRKTRMHRTLFYGPPGTGKTSFPHRVGKELGAAVYSITLTEETPSQALIGTFVTRSGDVCWMDGVATKAVRESHNRPSWLIFNEIDHASGDAMTKLIEVMDDPSLVCLYLPTGEEVRPKIENFRIFATTNAEPTALLAAVSDRLTAQFCVTHPHPGIISSLHTLHAKRLLCAAAREHSVRQVMAWDQLVREGWTVEDAAELVFDPAVAKSIADAAAIADPEFSRAARK